MYKISVKAIKYDMEKSAKYTQIICSCRETTPTKRVCYGLLAEDFNLGNHSFLPRKEMSYLMSYREKLKKTSLRNHSRYIGFLLGLLEFVSYVWVCHEWFKNSNTETWKLIIRVGVACCYVAFLVSDNYSYTIVYYLRIILVVKTV